MTDIKQYREGRSAGLKMALAIVREGGIEALENEIKFRERTKINTALCLKEIEDASKDMRGFINEAMIVMWLSVLHDEFDFGEKRLNRAMDRFEEIHDQIEEGYAGWGDYLELMQPKINRVLKSEYIVKDDNYTKKEEK